MTSQQTTLSGSVRLEAATEHPHAARRLRASFPGIDWTAGGHGPGIRLVEDQTLPDGGFRIDVTPGLVEVRGGPFSGVIYGVEELIERAGDDPTRLAA